MKNITLPQQQGYILVVGLLLLLILNIIGLSSMQSSIMGEKMTSNIKDRNVAFQASESAMKEAEKWISSKVIKPQSVSQKPVDDQVWVLNAKDSVKTDGKNWWFEKSSQWWAENANAVSDAGVQTSESPRYIIEELAKELPSGASLVVGDNKYTDWNFYYRITTQGVGGEQGKDSQARVVLQSVFAQKHDG